MVKSDVVIHGVKKFFETDILPQAVGTEKKVLSGVINILVRKAPKVMKKLTDNSFLKFLDLVDEEGNIDIDVLYDELLELSRESPFVISIPFTGDITLRERDIESIYELIMNAR